MRLSIRAVALGVCLLALSSGFASAAEPSTPSAKAAGTDTGPADAAKHAKRTACLKEAKAHKLVGADRNAYIKECLIAP